MKTSSILKKSTTLSMLFLLGACAGLSTKSKNEAQVKQVNKIALIAYTANLPASAEVGLNLSSGKTEGMQGGSMLTERTPETDRMFTSFAQTLQKDQKWSVMDYQSMLKNPGYQTAYKKTMEGWQNKMPAGQGTTDYLVNSVMDWNAPRLLEFDGREKLMVDLQVDAIAMLHVYVTLKGFTVAGFGAHKPMALAHIEIYRRGVKEPIWFETFEGVESDSVGFSPYFSNEKLRQLSLASAQSAYSKMNSKPE